MLSFGAAVEVIGAEIRVRGAVLEHVVMAVRMGFKAPWNVMQSSALRS